MRKQLILSFTTLVSLVTLVGLVTLSLPAAAEAQGSGSVPPPPGWKACPRCQNNTDRAASNKEYKVEGHAFDPHDLSGVWGFNGDMQAFAKMPPLTPWGKQQHESTIGETNAAGERLYSKDTSGGGPGSPINCDPMGWPRLYTYNYGFEFFMAPGRIFQFFELTHTWRTIWMDGRKLPSDPPEDRWLGWTVGHWEGDTLVVESTGFDERSWLSHHQPNDDGGGWTHSNEMRIVERWRRVNYTTLESQLTVTDPKSYTQPIVTPKTTTTLVPGVEIGENFCAPSDYNAFSKEVFLPLAGKGKK